MPYKYNGKWHRSIYHCLHFTALFYHVIHSVQLFIMLFFVEITTYWPKKNAGGLQTVTYITLLIVHVKQPSPHKYCPCCLFFMLQSMCTFYKHDMCGGHKRSGWYYGRVSYISLRSLTPYMAYNWGSTFMYTSHIGAYSHWPKLCLSFTC